MPAPVFDPFGYRRLAAAVETLAAEITANTAAIIQAVNAPTWLVQAAPAIPQATAAAVVVYPPVIDVGGQIYNMLNTIISTEGKIMTATTDLQAAVASLTSAQATDLAAIQAAVTALGNAAASGSVSQADAEAAVTAINNIVAQMASADTSLNTAVNPPPPAPPAGARGP